MFRTACIFVALALCAATAPPKISLDLSGSRLNGAKHPTVLANANKHVNAHAHKTLDYDETCELGSNAAACAFPVAKAFDHVGGATDVTTAVKLINVEGADLDKDISCGGDCENIEDLPKYKGHKAAHYRSQYVFQYDASDAQGNDAETVTYILSIVDTTAPTLTAKCGKNFNLEFGEEQLNKCQDDCTKPTSAVFVDRPADITKVAKVGNMGHFVGPYTWAKDFQCTTYGCNMQWWNDAQFSFTSVCDDTKNAGIYLASGKTLITTKNHLVTMKDTSAPIQTANYKKDATYECDKNDGLKVNPTYQADSPAFEDDHKTLFRVIVKDQNGGLPLLKTGGKISGLEKNTFACGNGGVGNCKGKETTVITYTASDPTKNAYSVKRTVRIQDTTPPTIEYYNKDLHTINNIQVGIRADKGMKGEKNQNGFDGKTSHTKTDEASKGNKFPTEKGVHWMGASSTWADITGMADKLMGTHKRDSCAGGEMDEHVGTWYKCDNNVARCLALATKTGVKECNKNAFAKAKNCRITGAGPKDANDYSHGQKYLRVHRITDGNGNYAIEKEIVTLVDEEAPIISVKGCDKAGQTKPHMGHVCHDTVDASDGTAASYYTDNWPRRGQQMAYPNPPTYKDQGASCYDFVDGPLSHAVEVSGAIVSLNHPEKGGKDYQINYNCQDLSGSDAPQASRIVTVIDRTAPFVTLKNAQKFDIEAGYPYSDPGATAIDDMATTGQLKITATYQQVSDDLKSKIGASCDNVADFTLSTNGVWQAPTESKACTVDTKTCKGLDNGGCKYTITYKAEDLNGNKFSKQRIVKVQDTLAPIIVLTGPKTAQYRLGSTLKHDQHNRDRVAPHNNLGINMEDANNRRAHQKATDIAKTGIANQAWMAETTSVNGWFIGAVACAVTGVALLSLATRKTSVTEVPV
jgi:hypothetical protein